MPKSAEDLEMYLSRLERRFERLEDGTYLIGIGPNRPPIAVRLAPPVAVVRVDIGSLPEDAGRHAALFRKLLELNASDLLHSAYGLDQNSIVLDAALELDNLDLNELEAVLADIDVAVAKHVPLLRQLVGG